MRNDGEPNSNPQPNFRAMTVTEAAEFLGVHRITVYRLITEGLELGQFKVGRVWRFSVDGLQRFVDKRGRLRKTNRATPLPEHLTKRARSKT